MVLFLFLQEDGNHTCNISIKFLITHEMMPTSRLVVYYFRSDGEAVADVMTFSVKPEFKHKASENVLFVAFF